MRLPAPGQQTDQGQRSKINDDYRGFNRIQIQRRYPLVIFKNDQSSGLKVEPESRSRGNIAQTA